MDLVDLGFYLMGIGTISSTGFGFSGLSRDLYEKKGHLLLLF